MATSVTAAQIAQLRRLVDEPLATTYSDELLTTMIEAHPTVDELGTIPYTWSIATDPPTKISTPGWIPTYDLNVAAADIWAEKAAVLARDYDFSADGAQYSRSQAYQQAMAQSRYYRGRRSPRTITQEPTLGY